MIQKLLIAGGSGLVGQRLSQYLPSDKYKITILSRSKKQDTDTIKYAVWNTDNQELDPQIIKNNDVIINLAGAGIADKRWTNSRKKLILESRVSSVETLAKATKSAGTSPVYIGASAIGYYGDQGDTILTETAQVGHGFLADVTRAWEIANQDVASHFSRQVLFRIGIVLSKHGGALKEILKPAALGSYGYFGDGRAYYSWIHIDDLCSMIKFAVDNSQSNGIYNATAPDPVTIKELVTAVKKAKNGFGLVMPVPSFALSLVLGEMTQMLTNSTRVVPKRLLAEGFGFEYTNPVESIRDILNRKV